MQPSEQVLEVWGSLACFTRPELKVERFSYPVITPSAARGIFDAIYCKPNKDPTQAEFRWQMTRVEVLSPPSYIALRRNEVKGNASVKSIVGWMAGRTKPQPLWADGDEEFKGRTQRQTMALKNVWYRIHAKARTWPGFEHRLPAVEAQFRRRASQGKCIYQPYFGCREFPAFFELIDEHPAMAEPVVPDLDIGLMLYDVFDLSSPGTSTSRPSISLFHAKVVGGVMEVPPYESDEVLKPGRKNDAATTG